MSDDTLTLNLEPRDVTGKHVKQLRANGTVPAVIHDHGKPSINVQAPYLDLYRMYQKAGKHHPVHLVTGTKKYTALIKSATFEPKKNQLTHVVFNAVNRNQKVEAEVPIKPRYAEGEDSSPAERATLIVLEHLNAVVVRAVPDKIPDALYYDASKLVEDGDQLTVADLDIPSDVEVDEELMVHPIVSVTTTARLEAANAALAGEAEATPEAAETEEAGEEGEAATEGESESTEESSEEKAA